MRDLVAEQASTELAADHMLIDHDEMVTAYRDASGALVGHMSVQHQSTEHTIALVNARRWQPRALLAARRGREVTT